MKEKEFLNNLKDAKYSAREEGWENGWLDAQNQKNFNSNQYEVQVLKGLTQEQKETYIREVKAEYSESYETSYHLEIKEKEEGVQAY